MDASDCCVQMFSLLFFWQGIACKQAKKHHKKAQKTPKLLCIFVLFYGNQKLY